MAVQDPSISGVPGRYATALFELAKDAKSVDKVQRDLSRFSALLKIQMTSSGLSVLRFFSADDQLGALEAVLKKAKISAFPPISLGW